MGLIPRENKLIIKKIECNVSGFAQKHLAIV